MEMTAQQSKIKQKRGKADHLAPYQFKPGQSGNPSGRTPGKSLKEYAKEMLASMTEEERQDYLKGLSKDIIWKMAEGNPKNDVDLNAKVTIADVIKQIENEGTFEQTMEDGQPLQDSGQKEEFDKVSSEQSPTALQPESVVEKFNP